MYRLLGDEARLRLLRVLARDHFNVKELTGILGLAQSGVSRHLGLLKDAGLVIEDREGAFTYYQLAPGVRVNGNPLWALLEAQFDQADGSSALKADESRLQEVLRLRRENFDRHAGPDTRDGRQLVPGRSWAAWSRALGLLLPTLDVADLGCGEGYLSLEAAQWARRVIAVDRSADVLARAKSLAARRHIRNVTWRRGELERLPIEDGSVDVALLSQALHHASEPARAVGSLDHGRRREHRLKRRSNGRNFLCPGVGLGEGTAVSGSKRFVEIGRMKATRQEVGLVEQPFEKRDRRPDAGNDVFVERPPHAGDGRRAILCPRNQFRDERVVEDRNVLAWRRTAVVADSRSGWCSQVDNAARRRQEIALGVLGIHAAFNGRTKPSYMFLMDRQFFTRGDANLFPHQIDSGDQFGHRMLDL